jgi:hypothetical protein
MLSIPEAYNAVAGRPFGGGLRPEPIGYSECVMLVMLALFHAALGALGGVLSAYLLQRARGWKPRGVRPSHVDERHIA